MSADEAELKRPVVEVCREVVAVVDRTKWGRVGVSSFATARQINKVITDQDAPRDLVDLIRSAGADVILV